MISLNKVNKWKLLIAVFVFFFLHFQFLLAEEIPQITVCPEEIISGEELLYLEGKATPNRRVNVSLFKEKETIIKWEVLSDKNGNWTIWEEKLFESGIYTVLAQTRGLEGDLSDYSEACLVKISLSGLSLGPWIISYRNLAFISALSFLLILLSLVYFFLKTRRTHKLIERETLDLKRKFYKEYNELKDDIEETLEMFRKAKAERGLTEKEKELEEELLKNLADVERVFKRELKDIEDIT